MVFTEQIATGLLASGAVFFFYTYFAYPALVWVLALARPKRDQKPDSDETLARLDRGEISVAEALAALEKRGVRHDKQD